MPLYFFIVTHAGRRLVPNTTGLELPGMNAAWEEAATTAGEMIRYLDGALRPGTEWSIQIQDAQRKPLRTIRVTFEDHRPDTEW
jgi:hypothetical protein